MASYGRNVALAFLVTAGAVQRRLLFFGLGILGPRRAYEIMEFAARRFYRLADAVREYAEGRCRSALGGQRSEAEIRAIAERAFVHRVWNLADLALAPRLLRPSTLARYGGRIDPTHRAVLLDAQRRGQPVILLTAYYGPYDLLPLFLGLNGIHVTAVYRPHPDRAFDRLRQSVRSRAGARMIPVHAALVGLPQAMECGEIIALLADHSGGPKGVPLSFLGTPTTAPRTVGLLAARHGAVVAVAVIRRQAEPFRFEIQVADLFGPEAWSVQEDTIGYITRRYCEALERVILEVPEQYLWLHRREPAARSPLFRTPDQDYASIE